MFRSAWNECGDGSGEEDDDEDDDEDERENERPPSTFGERLRAGRDDEEDEAEEEKEKERLQEQEGAWFQRLHVSIILNFWQLSLARRRRRRYTTSAPSSMPYVPRTNGRSEALVSSRLMSDDPTAEELVFVRRLCYLWQSSTNIYC